MNILMIGGTGYMGRITVKLLLDRGDAVTVFSRGTSRPEWWDRVEHIQGDRENEKDFSAKLKGKRFDAVIDTQAYKKEDVESAVATFRGNIGRYLMVSTGSVYLEGAVDFLNRCPYNEADVDWSTIDYSYPQGLDPYAVGKRHCEKWLDENANAPDASFPYTIVRVPAVMGSGDPTGRMWWWVQRALDGGGVIIPPDALGAYRTLYSADAAANFIRILDAPQTLGQTYYVAMPEIMNLRRWANLIWQAAGAECRITYVPMDVIKKQGGLSSYAPPMSRPVNNIHDLSKAEQSFGIVTTPVEEWIQATVDWYRDHYQGEDSEGYGFRQDELALAERWEDQWGRFTAGF
ncbi:MAG: NAD-dependent epimerase/dehydratase family protein [Chloroflexi bacterium]|nr:NAD-dependent epimerase/dehydratase family protein [Chloroflexota bacterium]